MEKNMRILGIDPGYAIVGYGVINAARGQIGRASCRERVSSPV